jgi:hypothetical protein
LKTNAQSRTALQPTTGNTTLTYKHFYGGRMVTMAGVYNKKLKSPTGWHEILSVWEYD